VTERVQRIKQWLRPSLLLGYFLLAGCASNFAFKAVESVPFKERGITQVIDNVRVTAAVPDAKETRELFGVSLYKRGVQPVWIEIENQSDAAIVFLPFGVDTDYHTPLEMASLGSSKKTQQEAEEHFWKNGINMSIDPGDTRSGFVFTNLDEGTKAFNVDLFNDEDLWQFTFFVPVPGLAIDHHAVDFKALYEPTEVANYSDPQAFIDALQALPCCTADAQGNIEGDPLNIVVIGEPQRIYYAVIRAGWDETESVSAASGFKTVLAFLSGGAYRYSPVSSLYLFGRKQDVALQRIRENVNERNHFRLWLAPITYEGQSVWVGQISRDIGVRFSRKTITTHKIDPDVDETREFLLENLAYHQVLEKFAYVGGVGATSIDAPGSNLTGDPYYTDGLRVILWIAPELTTLQDIAYVNWIDPRD